MSRRSAEGGVAQPRKKKPPAIRLSSSKSSVLGEASFMKERIVIDWIQRTGLEQAEKYHWPLISLRIYFKSR